MTEAEALSSCKLILSFGHRVLYSYNHVVCGQVCRGLGLKGSMGLGLGVRGSGLLGARGD